MTRAAIVLILILLLPAAGWAQTLKIATWNIAWLTSRATGDPLLPPEVRGRSPADFALLKRYAEQLNADVVALEEIDGPATAARVFAADRYQLHFTNDDVVQRTGFAIRRGIGFTANPDLVGLDVYPPTARFQLRSGADVTLNLAGGKLRILAVHLKTGCREDPLDRSRRPACRTLREQVGPLEGWIAQRRAEGVPFMLVGDFNRWMDGADDFLAALRQVAPLDRANQGLSDPCWGGGSFIDHILTGGAARGWVVPGSTRVLAYAEHDPSMKDRLSDHCPLSVLMKLPG